MKADKIPVTYNSSRYQLDGCMDSNIPFGEKTVRTPVYIKLDAEEQLLLSVGGCSQLGLVIYHPGVATTHVQDSSLLEDGGLTKLAQVPGQLQFYRTCMIVGADVHYIR
jgi:hypothetical protein